MLQNANAAPHPAGQRAGGAKRPTHRTING
jgi:hypothetical protein